MTHRDLFRKIKKLEKIEPSEDWIGSTRSFVLDYARIQEKNEKKFLFHNSRLDLTDKINTFFAVFRQRLALRAASFAVILIMAGNFVAAKAAESLPGDNLYAIKLLTEKAELALTFNEDKRIDLKFELVERRLNEFSRLVESGKVSPRGTDYEAVNIAMDGFQNQLNAAVGELDNAAKSGPDNSKTVAMAKITDSKTADYAEKIEKASMSFGAKTKGKVTEAINKIEEANISALTVLASANKKFGDSVESSNSKEIAQKVEEKIKNAEEKAKLIEEKVLSIKVSGTGADSSAETGSGPATKLLEEAKGVLLEAKNDLAGNDPGKALEKIIASNAMATAAEKIVDSVVAGPATPVMPDVSEPKPTLSATVSPFPAQTLTPSVSPSPTTVLEPTVSPLPTIILNPTISPLPTPILLPSVSPVPSPKATTIPATTPKAEEAPAG